jgi:hypothetical protein
MPIRSSAVGTIRNSRTSDIAKRMQSLFARIDRPARIYSSDLLRTGQTAEPIAKLFASDIEFSQDLREASCGVAEGKPQSWLQQRLAHHRVQVTVSIIESAKAPSRGARLALTFFVSSTRCFKRLTKPALSRPTVLQ